MTKALLTFSIEYDTVEKHGRLVPLRHNIKLYTEDDSLIWRIGSALGDPCYTLPNPKTIQEAKRDAIARYHQLSGWNMKASWL